MKKIVRMTVCLVSIFYFYIGYAENSFYGKVSNIPPEIQKLMIGHTWHIGCPVSFDQLAYLRLSYWGYDNKSHVGELIVHKSLANETLQIFKKLYDIKFPIQQMVLPERLPKLINTVSPGVETSLANNTSGFYCRQDTQRPSEISSHSYGLAIDINPLFNPALEGKNIEPETGKKYLDRKINYPGMIKENSPAFLIFTSHGWYWGGFYKQVDYMHFTKIMTKHYVVTSMRYIPVNEQIKNLKDY